MAETRRFDDTMKWMKVIKEYLLPGIVFIAFAFSAFQLQKADLVEAQSDIKELQASTVKETVERKEDNAKLRVLSEKVNGIDRILRDQIVDSEQAVIEKHEFVNRITVMIILMLQNDLPEKAEPWEMVGKTIRLVNMNRDKFEEAFK